MIVTFGADKFRSSHVTLANKWHVARVAQRMALNLTSSILMLASTSKMFVFHGYDIAILTNRQLRPRQDRSGQVSPRLIRSGLVKTGQEVASQIKPGRVNLENQ